MTSETLRDHFAAAALTGLLAQGDDGSFSEESYVRGAYRWADAMLRERAKTNHDAAREARASVESVAPQPTTHGDSDRTDKAAPRPSEGTGDTPKPISGGAVDRPKPIASEPAAWATFYPNGSTASVYVGRKPPHAEPLYRQPPCQDFLRKNLTLTDAEREAVERGYCSLMGVEDMSAECSRWDAEAAAVLRGLLERTGGEK